MRLRPLASLLGAALLLPLGSLGCGERSEPSAPEAARASADAAPAPAPAPSESARPAQAGAPATPDPASPSAVAEAPAVAAEARSADARPAAADRPAAAGAPLPEGESRPDRFADLETLCAALVRDYVDGTLTDYYRGLTMKTEFGGDLLRRGEDSMKPGRLLEAGRKGLGERPGDPALPSCEQLFDELDDLE